MDTPNIHFFVHDLADAAVKRRVEMLRLAGADVAVTGFVRDRTRLTDLSSVTILGQTHNAQFLHRIAAVLRQVFHLLLRRSAKPNADVIIARNLEMLFLAHVYRLRSPRRTPLIYECLDVHRLMLGKGIISRLLRHVERSLMRSSAGLITSSPAYVSEYFHSVLGITLPVILVENQVFGLPHLASPLPIEPGPPWVIVWNGAIRCAKSLEILQRVTSLADGSIRVVINGMVSYDQIPDFDSVIASSPWIEFRGAYRYPEDLDSIYAGGHFNWTIDMFWEGQNSTWALANRIYEGGRAGIVPLAQASVETGRYYQRLGIGVLLDELSPEAIQAKITSLTPAQYTELKNACGRVNPATWTMTQQGAHAVLEQICSVASLC